MRPELHVPVTERQKRILDFLKSREKTERIPPSIREIGAAVGLSSSSTVHVHLRRLYRQGLIDWAPQQSRSITLHRVPSLGPSLQEIVVRTLASATRHYSQDAKYWIAIRLSDYEDLKKAVEPHE